MPVSLYGQCADFDKINSIAVRHNIPVIEDACQSLGATYKGTESCALTTISCNQLFSIQAFRWVWGQWRMF